MFRLAAHVYVPDDRQSGRCSTMSGAWRQGVFRQAADPTTMALEVTCARRHRVNRQAFCAGFAWRHLGYARR